MMKTRDTRGVACPKPNHYQRLIQQATGAPVSDLAPIEDIMREEIFHSTLDWQIREQLAEGARQAQRRLNDDREMYDLGHACRVAMFEKMRAVAALRGTDTAGHRAAVARADADYEAAKAKLFARLGETEVN